MPQKIWYSSDHITWRVELTGKQVRQQALRAHHQTFSIRSRNIHTDLIHECAPNRDNVFGTGITLPGNSRWALQWPRSADCIYIKWQGVQLASYLVHSVKTQLLFFVMCGGLYNLRGIINNPDLLYERGYFWRQFQELDESALLGDCSCQDMSLLLRWNYLSYNTRRWVW